MARDIVVKAKLKDEVSSKLKGMSSNVKSGLAGLNNATSSLTGTFGKLKAAIGGVVVAIGAVKLYNMTKEIATLIDTNNKLAQSLGVTSQYLDEMNHVANLAGTSIQELVPGLKRVAVAAYNAADGQDRATKAFAQLGVQVRNNDGTMKNMETLINDTLMGLADMTNSTEKVALAQKLFGESGTKLIPVLNNGSEAIREQIRDARHLGVVFGEDLKEGAASFNDQLFRLKQAMTGLKAFFVKTYMMDFAEAFFYVAEGIAASREFLTNIKKSGDDSQNSADKFKFLAKTILSVVYAVTALVDGFKLGLNTIVNLSATAIASIVDSFNYLKSQINNFNFTKRLADAMDAEAAASGKLVKKTFQNIWSWFREGFNISPDSFQDMDEMIKYLRFIVEDSEEARKSLEDMGLSVDVGETEKYLNSLIAKFDLYKAALKSAGDFTEEEMDRITYKYDDSTGNIVAFVKNSEKSAKDFFATTKEAWKATSEEAEKALNDMAMNAEEFWKSFYKIDTLEFKPSTTPPGAGGGSGGSVETPDNSELVANLKEQIALYQELIGIVSRQEDAARVRVEVLNSYEDLIISNMSDAYTRELETINTNEQRKLDQYKEYQDQGIINEQEYQNIKTELEREAENERAALREETALSIINGTAEVANQLTDIYKSIVQARIDSIEKERSAEIASIENSRMSQMYKVREIERTNAKMDKERKKEGAKLKAASIIEATIATATGAISAFKAMAGIPYVGPVLGAIASAAVIAAGAIQIATISSQNFAKGGIVKGDKGVDKVPANLTDGEMVLNKEQQARLFNIANGRGGGQSISAGDTYVTINGNADADTTRLIMAESREKQISAMRDLIIDMKYHGEF